MNTPIFPLHPANPPTQHLGVAHARETERINDCYVVAWSDCLGSMSAHWQICCAYHLARVS